MSCLSGLGPTFRGCFAQPHAALLVFWLAKGFAAMPNLEGLVLDVQPVAL